MPASAIGATSQTSLTALARRAVALEARPLGHAGPSADRTPGASRGTVVVGGRSRDKRRPQPSLPRCARWTAMGGSGACRWLVGCAARYGVVRRVGCWSCALLCDRRVVGRAALPNPARLLVADVLRWGGVPEDRTAHLRSLGFGWCGRLPLLLAVGVMLTARSGTWSWLPSTFAVSTSP